MANQSHAEDKHTAHDRINEAYYGALGESFKKKTRKRIRWMLSNVKGPRVLDVGCSQGINTILLGRAGKKVIGIDVEKSAIQTAEQAIAREDSQTQQNVSFVRKNFLEYESRTKFDSILMGEVLEHLDEPEAFISHAHGLLKKGGTLIITVPFGINDHPDHKNTFYLSDIYRLISGHFHLIDVTIIEKWLGAAGNKMGLARSATPNEMPNKLLELERDSFYSLERELSDRLAKYKRENLKLREETRVGDNPADLKRRLLQAQEELNLLRNRLTAILSSKTHRSAKLIVESIRKPRRLVKLPVRLVKIVLGESLASSIYQDQFYSALSINVRTKVPTHKLREKNRLNEGKLRIATILDDFSYSSFEPEAELLQLLPQSWYVSMEKFRPDMLFVESAWRGKDGSWQGLVSEMSKDLDLLLAYCRQKNIPTVFWCKEDPVHRDKFFNTAKFFDYIFTSDEGSISWYKNNLKHSRVYSLRFAAQPRLMNPIEKYDRKNAVCFAGSYYAKYKERAQEFSSIFDALIKKGYKVDIYDRNFDRGDSSFAYPAKYSKHIKGALPFSKIDLAYKGYKYAITMNTVKDSKTMFARRAYELLACNTITISNDCLGVEAQLGDSVIMSDNGPQAVRRLELITKDNLEADKFRLQGVRRVLTEHTYSLRLHEMCEKIFSDYNKTVYQPEVLMIGRAENKRERKSILDAFNRQAYVAKRLIIVSGPSADRLQGAEYVSHSKALRVKIEDITSADYITLVNSRDFYGRHFLTDLINATRYGDKTFIGKAQHFAIKNGVLKVERPGAEYREGQRLLKAACLTPVNTVGHLFINEFINSSGDDALVGGDTLSIDYFNYCEGGAGITSQQMEDVEGSLTNKA